MARRRGRGEGSIFQRRDGSWCGTLGVGSDANGKRHRRYVYGLTKAVVLERLIQLRAAGLTGDLGEPSRLTVGAYLARWLEDSARPGVRPSTYRLYADVIRLHIAPRIGGVVLAKLGPVHVQHVLGELETSGASARTRQKVYRVLHRALRIAVQWGLASRNACQAVTCPRAPRPQVQALTAAEAARLIASAEGDRLGALYTLAVSTGSRQGELFGLRWKDVDLRAKAVFISHQLCELSGKLWLAPPKTKTAQRRVDLPEIAVRALQEHRLRMLTEGYVRADGFVFCDERGGPLRKSNVVRRPSSRC